MKSKINSRTVLKALKLLVLFVVVGMVVTIVVRSWDRGEPITEFLQVEGCQDVLETMLKGRWVGRPHTQQELDGVQRWIHLSRMEHSIPATLQRTDSLCGNVTFNELIGRMNPLMWFRAMCDPNGPVPCCYHNVCSSRSVEDCRCQGCYDMRQPIHAELSTWVPSDPTCKIRPFDRASTACQLLHNMTIYMLGDSLVRHLYISLLTILRQGKVYGALKEEANVGVLEMCDPDFILLFRCMGWVDGDTWECNNTVRLKFLEHSRADASKYNLEQAGQLIGKPNTLLFIGIGIHNDYNASLVINEVLTPLIKHLSSSPWPKLVWSASHAPGIMKTPRVPAQSRESVLAFNNQLRPVLDAHKVPVFDTFQLTDGVMSFDGVHFGRGVNDVKAQIFLNYVHQLRSKGDTPVKGALNATIVPHIS
ncbi:hypothetical protein BsWGS_19530 [Bradybaena similaris]